MASQPTKLPLPLGEVAVSAAGEGLNIPRDFADRHPLRGTKRRDSLGYICCS